MKNPKPHLIALALAAGTATLAAQAAADTPWSGAYAGLQAGSVWATAKYAEPAEPIYNRDFTMEGFNAGLVVGYNVRRGALVYGVEADVAFGKADKGPDSRSLYNDYTGIEIKDTARLRARVGWAKASTLYYVAGGAAMAKVTVDDVDPGWSAANSRQVGWTLGAGVEHALAKNLALRAEFSYDDYGSKTYTIGGTVPYGAKVDAKAHALRAGITYRF